MFGLTGKKFSSRTAIKKGNSAQSGAALLYYVCPIGTVLRISIRFVNYNIINYNCQVNVDTIHEV